MLDSREWAGIAWLAILAAVAIANRKVRRSLARASRILVSPQILSAITAYLAWVVLGLYIAHRAGAWTQGLLAPTVLWILGVGLVTLFTLDAAARDSRYVLRQLRSVLALTVVLEFFVNVRTFPFVVEFPLQGALGFIATLAAYAGVFPEHRRVASFLNSVLALAVLAFLVQGVRYAVAEPGAVFTFANLREEAMPVWLGLWVLPFMILLGCYANVERVFRMMALEQPDRWARLRNLLPLARRLGFSTTMLHGFRNYWERQLAIAPDMAAARRLIRKYVEQRKRERRAAEEEAATLAANAGVQGSDEHGRRLDRREFKETWDALDLIAQWHQGWYERDPRGYKAEKIASFIAMQDWRGLPQPHGIHMQVSADRQAWCAWRRTVTGWVLAVGGREGTRFPWRYDGPEPPAKLPEAGDLWGRTDGQQMQSPNW